jgi:glycolate oxidase iron-sulfur subunit
MHEPNRSAEGRSSSGPLVRGHEPNRSAEGRSSSRPLVRGPERRYVDECVHCGFCLPACPTYLNWGEEMDSPRGRIDLVRALQDGRIDLESAFVGHLDRCLGCLACQTACPSGVRYDHILEEARDRIEREHERRAGEKLQRWAIFFLFPYPRRLKVAATLLWLYRRSGVQWLLRRSGLLKAWPALAQLDGLAPPISLHHVTAALPEHTQARGAKRKRVGLLTGCVQGVFFPGVNEATVRVLAAEGCEVVVPPGQGCCGALSAHAGRTDEARAMVRALIERFEAADVELVVTNAAGCGSQLKGCARLFEGDPLWSPRAAAFAAKVKDVCEVLTTLPPVAERHPVEGRVAYHSPCHLGHAQGLTLQPRAILRAIPGLELVDVPEADQCCGSAGIYNLTQRASAEEIGNRKVDNVLSARAGLVASANPGCTLHIQRILRARGLSIEAAHPIEILDRSIQGRSAPRG